jgi:hypothetical protein
MSLGVTGIVNLSNPWKSKQQRNVRQIRISSHCALQLSAEGPQLRVRNISVHWQT